MKRDYDQSHKIPGFRREGARSHPPGFFTSPGLNHPESKSHKSRKMTKRELKETRAIPGGKSHE